MAQTLMAHSPGLARTMIMVHTDHFKHNPPWMAGTRDPLLELFSMVPSRFQPLKFYCIQTSHSN